MHIEIKHSSLKYVLEVYKRDTICDTPKWFYRILFSARSCLTQDLSQEIVSLSFGAFITALNILLIYGYCLALNTQKGKRDQNSSRTHSLLSLGNHSSWKPQPVLLAALFSTVFSGHMCWRDTVPSKPQIKKTNANLFCIFVRCFSLPILP